MQTCNLCTIRFAQERITNVQLPRINKNVYKKNKEMRMLVHQKHSVENEGSLCQKTQ